MAGTVVFCGSENRLGGFVAADGVVVVFGGSLGGIRLAYACRSDDEPEAGRVESVGTTGLRTTKVG